MKVRITFMLALIAAAFLFAIPALAQKVQVDWDHQADFTKYNTYVDANPDMFVVLHATYDEQTTLNTTGYGYGYGPYWRGGGGMSTTTAYKYTVGTMIVDIYDARTKQLIWRGTGSDTLSDKPEKNEKKINTAVPKMFQKFPPKPGK